MPPERSEDVPAPDPSQPFPEELQAQLRSAAASLAGLFGGDVERAERAMFESARELTRQATVLQYAPVLASRRARRLARQAEAEE